MRINVYDEEITGEVDCVTKTADTGLTFMGLRLYLASPDVLHDVPGDDDRSAITFWFERGNQGEEGKVRNTLLALRNVTPAT